MHGKHFELHDVRYFCISVEYSSNSELVDSNDLSRLSESDMINFRYNVCLNIGSQRRFRYHIRVLSFGIKCGYDLECPEKRCKWFIRINA